LGWVFLFPFGFAVLVHALHDILSESSDAPASCCAFAHDYKPDNGPQLDSSLGERIFRMGALFLSQTA
jgi:hypothetical protein